jgi:two-component system phosphate regulon sensor histidine kinase PhoR
LITLEKIPGDLSILIGQIVHSYEYNVSGCKLFVKADQNLPVLFFDPRKMTQVFDNLISNAVKFSPQGGKITITLRAISDGMRVSIEDQGVGMSPDQLERVFDKFYRADYSNTSVSGLGLGMSLVKSIIEGHGGRIWVESEPGTGTTVHLKLPGISSSEG